MNTTMGDFNEYHTSYERIAMDDIFDSPGELHWISDKGVSTFTKKN